VKDANDQDNEKPRPKGIDFSFKRSQPAAKPRVQMCEMPGCDKPGTHKAPKSRENTREHRWLCMPHVRQVNETWNYFAGMNEAEVSQFQRDAATGHRPTWKLKDRQSTSWQARGEKGRFSGNTEDTYAVFEDGKAARVASDAKGGSRKRILGKLQTDALTALGLGLEVSLNEVKARYKELVKRYHPDVNGGDRSAEERLAQVIRAYGVLKKSNFS
jgi:hypothetical protein